MDFSSKRSYVSEPTTYIAGRDAKRIKIEPHPQAHSQHVSKHILIDLTVDDSDESLFVPEDDPSFVRSQDCRTSRAPFQEEEGDDDDVTYLYESRRPHVAEDHRSMAQQSSLPRAASVQVLSDDQIETTALKPWASCQKPTSNVPAIANMHLPNKPVSPTVIVSPTHPTRPVPDSCIRHASHQALPVRNTPVPFAVALPQLLKEPTSITSTDTTQAQLSTYQVERRQISARTMNRCNVTIVNIPWKRWSPRQFSCSTGITKLQTARNMARYGALLANQDHDYLIDFDLDYTIEVVTDPESGLLNCQWTSELGIVQARVVCLRQGQRM